MFSRCVTCIPLLLLFGCAVPPGGPDGTSAETTAANSAAPSPGSPATLSFGAEWRRQSFPVTTPPARIPLLVVLVHWYAPYSASDGPYSDWYARNIGSPTLAHPVSYYDNLLFGSTFPSANQYYAEISLGKFQWVKTQEYGVFGQQLPSDGSGADSAQNLNRIVTLAAAQGFKFAPFDTNHDGKVTPDELALMMISDNGGRIAGANRGLNPVCVPEDGGVQVCSQTNNSGVAEIEDEVQFATLVHEMSHSLGTVDLYGNRSLDYGASLMGPTIENGADLVHTWWLDPWHRHQLAWTDGSPRDFDLRQMPLGTITAAETLPRGRAAFLWDSSRGSSEYFIAEYRNQSGYDRDAHDQGIAIWYVNEKTDGTRAMAYITYDGNAGEPGVVTYDTDGTHGGASFIKPANGWVPLNWADGSFSGFEVRATDSAGGYQVGNSPPPACTLSLACPATYGPQIQTVTCQQPVDFYIYDSYTRNMSAWPENPQATLSRPTETYPNNEIVACGAGAGTAAWQTTCQHYSTYAPQTTWCGRQTTPVCPKGEHWCGPDQGCARLCD
jgi:M6 family metalloprotease-like protein